jgi:cellulose synthase/poly-beta-1,6-N-acetylglucosamine synthase-like glycosyltransferase
MAQPFVTIAMPCLNEAGFIEDCLRSVQAQTYPRGRVEILVADGGSTDGTRDRLARLAAEDTRIQVIDNPDRYQAPGLNRILARSKGEVFVRMDVHCEYAPDYVEKCVSVLERTGADNVGGAQRCRGRTEFEKAVCAALSSPLGMGGAAYRSPDNEGFVDTVFLGAYRREALQRLGGWDPEAITNEDAELNQRLVDTGGRIYLSREIVVHYTPRGSLPALARQYFRYGQGRARTLLKHGRFLTLRPALPFLAVCTGILLIALLPWTNAAPYAAALAGAGIIGEAIHVGWHGGGNRVVLVATALPTIVVSHGVGFGAGLLRSHRRRLSSLTS